MKIDGKQVAKDIFHELENKVMLLKKKDITPHIAIILVGHDPASHKYVERKIKKAAQIGATATLYQFEASVTTEKLISLIKQLNNDSSVHGLIIQRPLPSHIDAKATIEATDPDKDLDRFHPQAPYHAPLAQAMIVLLQKAFELETEKKQSFESYLAWLQTKKIVILGKGETAGGPTIQRLKELHITPIVIDSKTPDAERKVLLKEADVIITTVGKENILLPDMIKKGVILIGAGMNRGSDSKLHGDYEDEEIKDIASFYTPIPGGVGPVNVALLLENLILAAKKQTRAT